MTPRPPADCAEMSQVRAEIDRIDVALVDLIAERFAYVDRAWQLKMKINEGARVTWRIQEVIDKVKSRAGERRLPPELAEALWRQMIGWFIQYEEESSGPRPRATAKARDARFAAVRSGLARRHRRAQSRGDCGRLPDGPRGRRAAEDRGGRVRRRARRIGAGVDRRLFQNPARPWPRRRGGIFALQLLFGAIWAAVGYRIRPRDR